MLSSCGARLLFAQDKPDQERQVTCVSPSSSNSNRTGRRDYCITAATAAAAAETSNHSSDHLEFTFSSGGQSLLVARGDSSGTSTTASSGDDQINRIGQHEFALVSSGEYHQLGLNSTAARFAREREHQSESEQHGTTKRQLDDSLPQPPAVAHSGDARSVPTGVRKLVAPLLPTHSQQQHQQQHQQNRKLQHHHRSIHEKLQQIYGSRLQQIELRQQNQRPAMIKQEQHQRGVCSGDAITNGHKTDCVAHHGHNHSQHLEQTYDSLLSINLLRPPAPPQPSLKSSQTNPGDFYKLRAPEQCHERAVPKVTVPATTSRFHDLGQQQEDDEGEDDEEGEEEEEAVDLNQLWSYGKCGHAETRARTNTRVMSGDSSSTKLQPARRRGAVSEAEHKRHLASIHYATSTAAALLNAAASATAAIATESTSDHELLDAHRAAGNLRPTHHNHIGQQIKHTPYAVNRPLPPERPYQQLYYHQHGVDSVASQPNKQQRPNSIHQQAAFLQWQRIKQQQRPRQQPVYQVYAPVPLYGHQNGPGERSPRAGAAALMHQLKLQQQRQGRQVSAGAPKTNSDAMLRAMIQNEKTRAEIQHQQKQQRQQRQPHLVNAQDARLLLSAARLNQANRIYENAIAGEMAHYQQHQRALMLAQHQLGAQKKGQIYAATARQYNQMPAPRPPPPVPLLPMIYNRLAPLTRCANDDEGARALLSGSSSSGESACHLKSTAGPLNYASMPLIMRRNGSCGPASARQGEPGLLGRLRRIDLTLFWWLLLIVCVISLALVAALTRVLAT